MSSMMKNYGAPDLDRGELLRYMGVKMPAGAEAAKANMETIMLMEECIQEMMPALSYRVCYGEITSEEIRASGCFNIDYLRDCRSGVIFAATVGIEADRLIRRYAQLSPARAQIMDALGTERIEGLVNEFNREVGEMAAGAGLMLKPRISPGYGAFSLEAQREIFARLNPEKNIGLTLNESLLMSPMKSVTGIIGIVDGDYYRSECDDEKCASCSLGSCAFRKGE